jgi:mercuric ion transport protein
MNRYEDGTAPERPTVKEASALLLALGGLAGAFGAASCCALPLLLSGLGVSSACLFGVAVLAAPHRLALIVGASLCLVGAAVVLALRRRAIACSAGAVCGHRAIAPLVIALLVLGAALAVAGYVYA